MLLNLLTVFKDTTLVKLATLLLEQFVNEKENIYVYIHT